MFLQRTLFFPAFSSRHNVVRATRFKIRAQARPIKEQVVVEFLKLVPLSATVTAEGFEEEERLCKTRVKLRGVSEVRTMVKIEVVKLESQLMKYEIFHQGRRIRYYLSKSFQTTEQGGHKLGTC